MFESLSNTMGNIGSSIGNTILGSSGNVTDNINLAVTNPGEYLSGATGLDHLKALTQSPENYQKWLTENPQEMNRFRAQPAEIPPLPDNTVPFAPTGGFINQMPNYLNAAQQTFMNGGGPYG